jgi:hypothetical protein
MVLPDCYEAHLQAEVAEAAYDKKCEAFPRCGECGGSLYPYDTYTSLGSQLYCEKCVGKNTHFTADMEVA